MRKVYFIVAFFFLMNSQYMLGQCLMNHSATDRVAHPFYKENFKTEVDGEALRSVSDCTNPVVIPIAVHFGGNIIGYGSATDSMNLISAIDDQIERLNQDFGGYNTDISNYCELVDNCGANFPAEALSLGTCIQFAIATETHPLTTLTNATDSRMLINGDYAITFGKHEVTSFNCSHDVPVDQYNCTLPLFELSNPEWAGYLNFYITDVAPAGGPPNASGAAPYLGGASDPNGTGVYINSSRFGANGLQYSIGNSVVLNNDQTLGRTGTHEVGHFMGLPHIFQQSYDVIPGDCGIDSDGISDTPIQLYPNFEIAYDMSNCGQESQRFTANRTSCDPDKEFFFNYMDYVGDDNMFMFTVGQATLMYNTVLGGTYKSTAINSGNVPNYNPLLTESCGASEEDVSTGPCIGIVFADYFYNCGGNDLTLTTGAQWNYNGRECGSSNPNSGGGFTGGGGNGGGNGGPGNPGGGGTTTVGAGSDVPVVNENDECQECVKELKRKIETLKNMQNQEGN